jgi:hypothetical protein
VQLGQAIRHVFAGVDRLVFGRVGHGAAGADGLDERVPVWLPEPGDGVAGGDDCGAVGGRLFTRGGLDDPVLGAAECVIEPAGEEIADCVGLRGESVSEHLEWAGENRSLINKGIGIAKEQGCCVADWKEN